MRPQLTVADLCLCRQRSDLASFQQSHDFQILDQGIQRLITTLSDGPKSFEELRTVTRKENEETREHISKAFEQQQRQLEEKECRKRLLDSLWFDEIYSREENIVDAHRETFEWIFDASDHAVGLWDNFVRWLEGGQGTYWINGKAGSGKSTLMSFLCQDDRTMESLRSWSRKQNKNVFMPKFFFWSAGTQMEKSIEGLLRSLIWQVLHLLPDLEITSSASHSRDTIAAWTERRLQKTLRSLLQQASSSHFFCFFIDGLDEYEGDQVDLINFIQDLVQSTAVKVCLSSRPYRVFDQAFGLSARLRLQDLTHNDIQKFVVDRFQGMPQVQSIATQRPGWLVDVTSEITARADGVFLWVNLAVKDQIRGLENDDSSDQLKGRLETLPDEVEGIYARMLSRIEKVYRKEASIFLQMASQTECRSVLDFVLASQDRLDDMLSSSDSLPQGELITKSHAARQRIVTICAGLLEVNDNHEVESHEHSNSVAENLPLESENASLEPDNTSLSEDASSESENVSDDIRYQGEATDHEVFDLHRKVTVNFIHRTARDFVQDSAQGGTFLKANTPSGFHPQASYVKVQLAKARLFGFSGEDVDDIMWKTGVAEDMTGVAQTRLCDLIDDVMSRIDRTCGPWPTISHWSKRIRWARDNLRSMHRTLWRSMHRDLLPSRSDDSFHSVNSQPDTPDELRKTLIKNPDFLAFAVYHSLHRYVQKVLDGRKEPLEPNTASYLLYCAVHCRSRYPSQWLIEEFLRQGGNPNLKDPNLTITIWSVFLVRMHDDFQRYDYLAGREESRRPYMESSVAFVEKGADLDSICTVTSYADGWSLDLDFSALAVIDLCLKDQLGYSHLRNLCATKDAPYFSRCTRVTARPHKEAELRNKFKVSNRESTAILEIHKRLFPSGSARTDWDEMTTYLDEMVQDPLGDASEPESL